MIAASSLCSQLCAQPNIGDTSRVEIAFAQGYAVRTGSFVIENYHLLIFDSTPLFMYRFSDNFRAGVGPKVGYSFASHNQWFNLIGIDSRLEYRKPLFAEFPMVLVHAAVHAEAGYISQGIINDQENMVYTYINQHYGSLGGSVGFDLRVLNRPKFQLLFSPEGGYNIFGWDTHNGLYDLIRLSGIYIVPFRFNLVFN